MAALGLLLAVSSSADPSNLTLTAGDVTVGEATHATAELVESPNAEGEITFEVFGPSDPTCVGPALTPAPAPATVSGNGEYSSGDFTPEEAGTYHWSAHYPGDENNPPADSECSAVSNVAKATPSVTGSASDSTVGSAIHDEATVSGGFSPTGEVVFRVYAPSDSGCLTPLHTDAVTIDGGGEATSPDFLPQQAGEFRWTATYQGDANNKAVSTSCGEAGQSSTVEKASPGLSATATSAVTVGATITDDATLSGGFQPGGQLRFRAYGPGDTTCTGAVAYEAIVPVSGNGPYAPAGFAPGPGVYRWTVAYEGDGNNKTAAKACGATGQSSTVEKATPGLSATATSAVTVGTTITDNATLSGGFQPGGQLRFRAYGPGDTTCTGAVAYEATVAVSGDGSYAPAGFAPGPGVYRWTVAYEGDANNEETETSCGDAGQSSTVSKASPGLSATATSATVGAAITDNATLSGGFQPGGTLRFRAYGPGDTTCTGAVAYEATVPVSGDGPYAPTGFEPSPGLYRWMVRYGGDANNEATETACGESGQTSTVSKATPSLGATATSATVGGTITDNATLSGGFQPSGTLRFRAYGPGDTTCTGAVAYEATVPVSGDGSYAPAGFKPSPGLYRWTVAYEGDANNEAAETACGDPNQSSAVGTITLVLETSATSGTVGTPVTAKASLKEGAIPAGQITFAAFAPGDADCSGPAVFTSTVAVSGVGSYSSAAFVPSRVGAFRWTVAYSGDPNHAPAAAGCGKATSNVSQARPSISTSAPQRFTVGNPIRVTAAIQGGYAPTGTVSFQIYGPDAGDCAKPLAVDTVVVTGPVVVSDPFVTRRPGRYRFTASYSGDAANQKAAEPCDPSGETSQVEKRMPKLKPRARLLKGNLILIRAHLAGALSPSGVINFRLFRPGDKRCKGKPVFTGGITVKKNGSFLLAQYFATKRGIYRLSVGYSGDQRNRRSKGSCARAQMIPVG
ncbi:MAG TPA: hypothetical protein VFI17_08565 [Solirubrobacterales bacterium]|nr:hypothetical protein [Solirubrobacterales bacterium]